MRILVSAFSVVLLCAGVVIAEKKPAIPKPTETFTQAGLRVDRYESACSTYLLTCVETGEFVVIDPSPKISAAIGARPDAAKKLRAIWITHEHGDHLAGLAEVLDRWKVPCVSCEAGRKGIAATREHWKVWGFEGQGAPPDPDTLVKHGGKVKVGKLEFAALLLPGHARGSIGYLLPDRLLFAGDVLFKGSVGRTDLDTSDLKVFQKSLSDHLWDLPDKIVVFPGHGEKTTMGTEKKANWLFEDYVRTARGLAPIARPWFGVGIDRERKDRGVRFTVITKDSPAEKCGLKVDDVLVSMGGAEIADTADFMKQFLPRKVGEKVALVVLRGEEKVELSITFTARPVAK